MSRRDLIDPDARQPLDQLQQAIPGGFNTIPDIVQRRATVSGLLAAMEIPPNPNVAYSAALMSKVEETFLTGKPPYPVERTLLTTGLVAAGVQSLAEKEKRLRTPHLAIRYEAPKASTFWRD